MYGSLGHHFGGGGTPMACHGPLYPQQIPNKNKNKIDQIFFSKRRLKSRSVLSRVAVPVCVFLSFIFLLPHCLACRLCCLLGALSPSFPKRSKALQ